MGTTKSKPRRAWVAVLLNLIFVGPVGQIYAGHILRSIVLWATGICLATIWMIFLICLPLSRTGIGLLLLCLLGFPIFVTVDAALLARKNRNSPLKRYQRWWIYPLASLIFILANSVSAHVIKSYVVEAFVMPTGSMSPTIQPGDRILVDKWSFQIQGLRRNDLAVFYSDGPNSPYFVMRVVGLPGDEVEIIDEHILINGEDFLDEHAVYEGDLPRHLAPRQIDIANYGPEKIPKDRFFVLGDNRRRSLDSRFIGLIPLSDLHGKARVIYWSRSREFPDPYDRSQYTKGRFRWERIGKRLD